MEAKETKEAKEEEAQEEGGKVRTSHNWKEYCIDRAKSSEVNNTCERTWPNVNSRKNLSPGTPKKLTEYQIRK
jgi:hypothetical protein